MKKYEAPSWSVLVLTADLLMTTNENELEYDDISSILNIFDM